MKPSLRLPFVLLLALTLAACTTVYTGIVTVTSVVDTSLRAWADLSNSGKTTPDIDAKVRAATAKYQIACSVASSALKAYKASNDPATYNAAVDAVKAAAAELIDLILPLLTTTQAGSIQSSFAKAHTL